MLGELRSYRPAPAHCIALQSIRMGRPLTSIYRIYVIEGIEGMGLVFFVTGSSRGLGRQIVEQALAAGHRVVATARQPKALDGLVARHGERTMSSNSTSRIHMPYRPQSPAGPPHSAGSTSW